MRNSKKESYEGVKNTILDTAQIQKHVELLADGAADAYLCSRSSQHHEYKIPLNFYVKLILKQDENCWFFLVTGCVSIGVTLGCKEEGSICCQVVLLKRM